MDKSNEKLYRKTLFAASGVFIVLMCIATTARALVPHSETHTPTASVAVEAKTELTYEVTNEVANEVTNIGRFVVTPSSASFVSAPAETVWGDHAVNHIERAAL